jgi:hypothetical protein
MRQLLTPVSRRLTIVFVIFFAFSSSVGSVLPTKASAAELNYRTLQLSSSLAGDSNVTYNISFSIVTTGTLGSIEFEFCSNSTFPSDVCVAPAGMDASNTVFTQESGISGFTILSKTANEVVISRPPTPTLPVNANVLFNGITNSTAIGPCYLRVLTFPTSDASGSYVDSGGMAFSITNPLNVNATVPPYLLFCTGNTISGNDCSTASGDFIDLGPLTTGHTSSGQSQMLIATNAKSGYSIYATGNTLTSGNNTIPALSVDSPAQTGVSQFGINLTANTSPSVGQNPNGPGAGTPTVNYDQPNQFRFVNDDVVATTNGADTYKMFTVSYMVNISKAQPAGIYAGTFTYVALGNF